MDDVVYTLNHYRVALMTAGELTYYHGAHLAHVVAYEEQLRQDRLRRLYPVDRRTGSRRPRHGA